jgi:hypothetical protein
MENQPKVQLTATEITSLWQQFIFESMDICIKKYVLKHIEDADIQSIYKYALSLSENHIEKVKYYFNEEKYPLPIGFTDKDVHLNAPRLYSDVFWLKYIQIMSANGIPTYGIAITTAVRSDIRDYFTQCNMEASELYNKSMDVLLSKGLFIRPPYIPPPDKQELIKNQSLLKDLFGNRRPLNGFEISHIFFNLQKTDIVLALLLGFSQVIQSKKIREFIIRVSDAAGKHSDLFQGILKEDQIVVPRSWESEVTNSTTPPFSDKLMMSHAALALSSAILNYGAALSTSMRKDLVGHYMAIIAKVLILAEDAQNIMVDNGWLEEPPHSIDHEALIKL